MRENKTQTDITMFMDLKALLLRWHFSPKQPREAVQFQPNTSSFSIETYRPVLRHMWKFRRPRIVRMMLEKNKVAGLNT